MRCATPQAWVDQALSEQEILLIDHANCEKKAAASAMNLMYRYVDKPDLLQKMSQLAREELLHFEQVVNLMLTRNIKFKHLGASRYASSLRNHIRSHEPVRLIDTLIVGAFIEARSCERFAVLAPHLDALICKFYQSLLKSESRHFEDYLQLASLYSMEDIQPRVEFFAEQEKQLILKKDKEFRFHSGVPF